MSGEQKGDLRHRLARPRRSPRVNKQKSGTGKCWQGLRTPRATGGDISLPWEAACGSSDGEAWCSRGTQQARALAHTRQREHRPRE